MAIVTADATQEPEDVDGGVDPRGLTCVAELLSAASMVSGVRDALPRAAVPHNAAASGSAS
jgi:hypothetical protein